jgi:hypothetical protein
MLASDGPRSGAIPLNQSIYFSPEIKNEVVDIRPSGLVTAL